MPRRQAGSPHQLWSRARNFLGGGTIPSQRRTRRFISSELLTRPAEVLELRTLLSATELIPAVEPMWFQAAVDAAGGKQSIHTDPAPATQDWVVQLQVNAAGQFASVDQAAGLFDVSDTGSAARGFEVVKGLGLQGQVLLRTWGFVPGETAQWLTANPNVSWFTQNSTVSADALPNDPAFGNLWNLENTGQAGGKVDADIDASAAWDVTTGSSKVVVAVIDTGIDYNHPDLAANIWINPGEIPGDGIDNDGNGFVDDVRGWDFANNDANPMDDNGHGTHVAGTIGAVGNNGIGISGVNWNVSLMPLKFLAANGSGYTSDAIAAINYATMMRQRGENVRVSNNSWAGADNDPWLKSSIQAAGNAGILFVAAAGNSGVNIDVKPTYPASFNLDNVLTVAATDKNDALASFSNFGVNSVDLAAPGVNIYSTMRNNAYATMSGTSMAAPAVTGAAALAWSVVPDADYHAVRNAILAGVDPLASLTGKVATGGRLNAAGMLHHLSTTPYNYGVVQTDYQNIDLDPAAANVTTLLEGADDATTAINLGSNTLRFYGNDYTGAASLYVSTNGLITFGGAYASGANTDLSAAPDFAAIAPFWDDLHTDGDPNAKVLARFDDLTGDGVADRLVLEWQGVRRDLADASTGTFQVILQLNTGTSDGDVVFNYADLDFANPAADNGAGATIGIKQAAADGGLARLISLNSASSPLVGSGLAILLDRQRPTAALTPVSPNPRTTSVDSIDVTFSELMDLSTFDYRDLTLTRSGSPNLINSSVTVSYVSGTTYRINGLASLTSLDGVYDFTIDYRGIADRAGNVEISQASDHWTRQAFPNDIQVVSATADGKTTLSVTYQISGIITPFAIGFYRSADATYDAADVALRSVNISDWSDLTPGVHTKSWTIGSATGQIPLPGAGATEVDTDYYVLAVADPTNAVPEVDASIPGANNVASLAGVYHAANGQLLIQGSQGVDNISFNGVKGVTWNGTTYTYPSDISAVRIRTHGGNDVINASTVGKVVLAYGGDGDDNISGGTANDILYGGAGSDTITGNAGNDILIGEGGNDTLEGSAGDDTFKFNTDTALGADTISDSAGSELLDFSETQSVGVTVNLGITTAQVVNSNLTLTITSATVFEKVYGGARGDNLIGNTLANTLMGGAGDDVLAGGAGNDTYVFDADMQLGSDQIVEAAAEGGDTLTFATTTTKSVTVDLSRTALQVVNSNLSLTLSSDSNIESVTGGSLDDVLIGNAVANRLTGGPGNDTLQGGGGNDTYAFAADTALGCDTLVEATGGGADLIDLSAVTTLTVAVDLSLTTAQVVNKNLTLTLSAGNVFENVTGGAKDNVLTGNVLANVLTGGAGNDTLSGGDGNDTLNGNAGNDTLAGGDGDDILSGGAGNDTLDGGAGNDTLAGTAGNDSLSGGLGDDTYLFDADSALGMDTIVETSGGGTDTLNFSSTTTVGISIDLSSTAAQIVNSNLTLTLSSGDSIENVIGGALNDVVIGNLLANVLTGNAGDDVLTGGAGNDTLVGGAGNDTLSGGDGNDLYQFDADSALGSDILTEATTTTSGVDLIDFSATTSYAVSLDLSLTTLQVVATNLSLTLSSGSAIEMVIGTTKNDTLRGNGLDNVLIGGAGNDILQGGGGRDFLGGGSGVDTLSGDAGDDLLLSGVYSIFNESTRVLNRPAIDAVMAEWVRSDADYAARISHLRSGGGLNGTNLLNSTTVLADGTSVDTMTGGTELDWFWKFGTDIVADLGNGGTETVN